MTASLPDALAPEDDVLVRTALRGLRIPQHHDDFWDVLGRELDLAAEVLVAHGLLVEPEVAPLVVELPAAPAGDPAPPPILDPEIARIGWEPAAASVAPAVRPEHAPHRPRRQPLRAGDPPPVRRGPELEPLDDATVVARRTWPAGDAPAAGARATPVPAPGPRPVRRPPSAQGVRGPAPRRARADSRGGIVDHDPAVLPSVMRRRSNAVLLAVAAVAAVVAVLAALTLLRQRSADTGSPERTAVEQQDPTRPGGPLDDPLGDLPGG